MKKRLLSILLVIVMVFSLLPTVAFAGTTYAITNGTTQSDAEKNNGYITIDKENAAEGDTVTVTVNPADGYQLKSLTAVPEAKTISTIADVLATVEGFPEDSSRGSTPVAPLDAWVNESNGRVFVFPSNNNAYLIFMPSTGYKLVNATTEVIAGENCYTASISNGTLKFNMKDDVLTSIEYTSTNDQKDYDGTYTSSAITPAEPETIIPEKQTDGTYQFTMPAANVTVTAEFEKKGSDLVVFPSTDITYNSDIDAYQPNNDMSIEIGLEYDGTEKDKDDVLIKLFGEENAALFNATGTDKATAYSGNTYTTTISAKENVDLKWVKLEDGGGFKYVVNGSYEQGFAITVKWSIVKKPIQLMLIDINPVTQGTDFAFTAANVANTGLIDGDSITAITYEVISKADNISKYKATDPGVGETNVVGSYTVLLKSITIKDAGSNDVTANYELPGSNGVLCSQDVSVLPVTQYVYYPSSYEANSEGDNFHQTSKEVTVLFVYDGLEKSVGDVLVELFGDDDEKQTLFDATTTSGNEAQIMPNADYNVITLAPKANTDVRWITPGMKYVFDTDSESGSPTFAITIKWTVAKASQTAPAKGEGYSLDGSLFLTITNGYEVNTANDFTGDPIANGSTLSGGTYYIRKAETDTHLASPATAFEAGHSKCEYDVALCLTETTMHMVLDGCDKGEFTFIKNGKGWSIMNSEGKYLGLKDGKLTLSSVPFKWSYAKDSFSATETVTVTTPATKILFIRIPGTTKKVTTTYYLNTVKEGDCLSLLYVFTGFYKHVESSNHTFTCPVDCKNGTHMQVCIYCGEIFTEEHHFDNGTHKCICGAYDPAFAHIDVSASVKSCTTKKATSLVGLIFGKTKTVTTYTATISAKGVGLNVTKVEYATSGNNWKTGCTFTSNDPITSFKIRVTASDGRKEEYIYRDGNVYPAN